MPIFTEISLPWPKLLINPRMCLFFWDLLAPILGYLCWAAVWPDLLKCLRSCAIPNSQTFFLKKNALRWLNYIYCVSNYRKHGKHFNLTHTEITCSFHVIKIEPWLQSYSSTIDANKISSPAQHSYSRKIALLNTIHYSWSCVPCHRAIFQPRHSPIYAIFHRAPCSGTMHSLIQLKISHKFIWICSYFKKKTLIPS